MEEINKMKILITGALGHIGSKFIHNIKPDDFEKVIMIDNMLTQRFTSLFRLPKRVNYKFIETDILKTKINKLVKDVDVVLHFAAITDATASFNNHKEVELVNFHGTEAIAKACYNNNVKLFFPSTTSVYGSQSSVVDEDCNLENLEPQSPYAQYKLKSEEMLKEMSVTNGLECIICRFGTIFGPSPGMRFHTAVNKFCWQAVMSQPLTVWKTAMDQKRPYLGVQDSINVINFIIRKNLFDNEVYNIVSSNNTVRDIIDIIKITVPNISVNFVETEIMNQLSYEVLSDKFKSKGFIFNDEIKDGILETITLLKN